MRIHFPNVPGAYAVVMFQHGFLSLNSAYDEILRHLASHGFVVVAPQMYAPGLEVLFGDPSAAQEAERAARVIDWLPGRLSGITGVQADTTRLGLCGHSRGGKVIWSVLSNDPQKAMAVAGVDPVDGVGGPLGTETRIVDGAFGFDFPTLVIGTALGGSCAPDGDNHEQFYAASAAPAWHVIALEHGHADMLDDDVADQGGAVCPSGDGREAMRRLTAGLLVAFFRGSLQDDDAGFGYLTDTAAAPASITVENLAG
jgi:chlorophyllase